MAWVSLEPLKPSDIIQVLAIPLSVVGAYFIFRLGEQSASKRIKTDFLLRQSSDCIAILDALEQDAFGYWQSPATAEVHVLESKLTNGSKRLSAETSFLATSSGIDAKFFSAGCIELRMCATGGDFMSKNRKQLQKRDEQMTKISSAASELRKELKSFQSDLIQKS